MHANWFTVVTSAQLTRSGEVLSSESNPGLYPIVRTRASLAFEGVINSDWMFGVRTHFSWEVREDDTDFRIPTPAGTGPADTYLPLQYTPFAVQVALTYTL